MINETRLRAASRMTFTGKRYPAAQAMAIWVDDGVISGDEPVQVLDVEDGVTRWIVPGFFDLQVNGFAGHSFCDTDVTAETVEAAAKAQLATGVTHFLPTIITGELDAMCKQLGVIADAIETIPLLKRMCPGMHLEVPFIHPDVGPRGAHPKPHLRQPNLADFDRLFEAARGKMAMFTLAPDQPNATAVIREATKRNVVVALGHHRATAEDLDAAIGAGAKLCTHLGNGSDAVLPRLDNPIWRQLGDDRLWASFIADGHHLPAPTLKSMLRAKGPLRSVLVTDAIAAAGAPPGTYRLGDTDVERTAAGKVVLPGTPYLAGSAADMPLVVGNAVRLGGVSFLEAVAMASVRPAMLLPNWTRRWSAFGGDACDLVELDWRAADGALTIRQAAIGPFAWISTDPG